MKNLGGWNSCPLGNRVLNSLNKLRITKNLIHGLYEYIQAKIPHRTKSSNCLNHQSFLSYEYSAVC